MLRKLVFRRVSWRQFSQQSVDLRKPRGKVLRSDQIFPSGMFGHLAAGNLRLQFRQRVCLIAGEDFRLLAKRLLALFM